MVLVYLISLNNSSCLFHFNMMFYWFNACLLILSVHNYYLTFKLDLNQQVLHCPIKQLNSTSSWLIWYFSHWQHMCAYIVVIHAFNTNSQHFPKISYTLHCLFIFVHRKQFNWSSINDGINKAVNSMIGYNHLFLKI